MTDEDKIRNEDIPFKLRGIAHAWRDLNFGNIDQGQTLQNGWYLDCRSNDNSLYTKMRFAADYCYHIHLYDTFPGKHGDKFGVALLKQNQSHKLIYADFLKYDWNLKTKDEFEQKCREIAQTIYDKARFKYDINCSRKSKFSRSNHNNRSILCDEGASRKQKKLQPFTRKRSQSRSRSRSRARSQSRSRSRSRARSQSQIKIRSPSNRSPIAFISPQDKFGRSKSYRKQNEKALIDTILQKLEDRDYSSEK